MTAPTAGPTAGPALGPAVGRTPGPAAEVVESGLPSADRRLGPYTVLAVGGLVAALVTGQAALVAVAAPAAVLLVRGLADRRHLDVRVAAVEAPERLLEGDAWTLHVELEWAGPAVLDVIHTGIRGSEVDGVSGWTVRGDDGVSLDLRAVARRWGVHDLGSLAIRAHRPGGHLRWDSTVRLPGSVRVLPVAAKLDELLRPRRPRVAAGSHVAPVRGAGTDFADLRPYVPGDRLRDLSWTATARSDQPWVVVHHPERTASVVLLLDAFVEVGTPPGSLDRAARVVWSVARHHLDAGDRVGLLASGTAPVWLSPVSGRRARWQVLDALLTVGSRMAGSRTAGSGLAGSGLAGSGPVGSGPLGSGPVGSGLAGSRTAGAGRDIALPADAVVLGVSPLQSDAFTAAVVHHARLGRPTAVIGVETVDLLDDPSDDFGDVEVERAARRLWSAEVDARAARLQRAGIPTVRVVDDARPAIRLLAGRIPRRDRRVA